MFENRGKKHPKGMFHSSFGNLDHIYSDGKSFSVLEEQLQVPIKLESVSGVQGGADLMGTPTKQP